MKRDSLQFRLLLWTFLWMTLALGGTGLILTKLFEHYATHEFRSGLQVHLDQLTAHTDFSTMGAPVLNHELSEPRFNKPYSGLYWQISTEENKVLLRSRSLWDDLLPAPPARSASPNPANLIEYRATDPANTPLFILERSIFPSDNPAQRLYLQVAADSTPLARSTREFSRTLALGLFILGIGLSLAVILQTRRSLTPLAQLRTQLNRIESGQTRELQGRFPSEIQPLVDAFNKVLEHDTEILHRARTQAGNLAHALKTPLSILAHAAGQEKGELGKLLKEQVDLARRQIDYHLARSRAAAALQIPGQSTPVLQTLQSLLKVMQRLHIARGLVLTLDCTPENLSFRGELQDFQEILGNLLDNACKWARHRVLVEATRDDAPGMLRIRIIDDGPGLSAEQREAVFKRGVRADEERPGSGLGLAIARDLTLLYEGSIELYPSPEGGLTAELRLPANP